MAAWLCTGWNDKILKAAEQYGRTLTRAEQLSGLSEFHLPFFERLWIFPLVSWRQAKSSSTEIIGLLRLQTCLACSVCDLGLCQYPDSARDHVNKMPQEDIERAARALSLILGSSPAASTPSGKLLDYIKRLRNEPKWPPKMPIYLIFRAPERRILVTCENGAHELRRSTPICRTQSCRSSRWA